MTPWQESRLRILEQRLGQARRKIREQQISIFSLEQMALIASQLTVDGGGDQPSGPTTGIKVGVSTCQGAVITSGVHFTIKQGGVPVADGTTDAAGILIFGLPPGTYFVVMDDADFISSGGQAAPYSVPVTVANSIASAGFGLYPATWPLDVGGTIYSFTWNPLFGLPFNVFSGPAWELTTSVSTMGGFPVPDPPPFGHCEPAMVNTPVRFRLPFPTANFQGVPIWTMIQYNYFCSLTTSTAPADGAIGDELKSRDLAPPGYQGVGFSSSPITTPSCNPISLAFDFAAPAIFPSVSTSYTP